MTWEEQQSDFLPENDDDFDADELVTAMEAERNREYAALFEAAPRWLDDVA
jgi:hypothetical protein